mmetsp:Transcript_62313/g.184381  ORF Transcript_62313/g.184381 Transcript_62313/m.184381 type:complete len:151 (+) Transcript_62313:1031-1483(+)
MNQYCRAIHHVRTTNIKPNLFIERDQKTLKLLRFDVEGIILSYSECTKHDQTRKILSRLKRHRAIDDNSIGYANLLIAIKNKAHFLPRVLGGKVVVAHQSGNNQIKTIRMKQIANWAYISFGCKHSRHIAHNNFPFGLVFALECTIRPSL